MGITHIMRRGGDSYHEYKKAVKMAKDAIETICELTEEMEEEFGERSHMRDNYSRHDDRDEMDERRGRDSHGRYRE